QSKTLDYPGANMRIHRIVVSLPEMSKVSA
ncbi:unnamed protein product, partial [marine sediment metagenome]